MKKITNYLKTLLVAAMVMVGSSAWADETTVTYDFTSYSARTLTNSSTKAFAANSVNHNYASNLPEAHNRFAFQFAGTFSVENAGLYVQRAKGDQVGILGLSAGDKVTINFSQGAIMLRGAVPTWAGTTSDWTTYTTGTEITTSTEGNISFQAKNSCKITSIVIKTSVAETMTAPVISSVANGSARTVSITDGASSLLSGVTTYYTTDGSTPTASSTKYTAPFDVNETSTIKAITISNSSAATESTIATEVIDLDVIDVPTANITAVNGISRTVSFDCSTEGTTLSYSIKNADETWTDYVDANNVVISANTTLKVKATKGVKETVSGELNFAAGTEIKLNAPTWNRTSYSNGIGTIELTSNQSNILLTPVASIYYQIDGGEAINYSSAFELKDGQNLTIYATAAGYTQSNDVVLEATSPFIGAKVWEESYVGTVDKQGITVGTTPVATIDATNVYEMTAATDGTFTNHLFAESTDAYFLYRTGGLYSGSNKYLGLTGLKAGQYVTIQITKALAAVTNMTLDVWQSYGDYYRYYVNSDGDVRIRITKESYLKSVKVESSSVSKEITSAGYATFCSPYALDFTGTGLTAYIAKVDGEKNVSFEEVTSVPANTGVLLKGEANTYEIPVAASSTTDVIDNAFIGTTTGTTAPAGSFVLMADPKVGFYKTTSDFTVGANTAYLPKAVGGARAFIGFDFDEATAIKAIEGVKAENGAFNLRGQRVKNLTKGLYIVNGKKVVK